MTAPLTFTVPGPPVAKARARVCVNRGKVHSFTPDKTARYENLVRLAFREAYPGHVPTKGPILLSIGAFFQAPKYLLKKYPIAVESELIPHTTRPDMSNIFKAVEDALNGVCYCDDSTISDYGKSGKRYSLKPRVRILIQQIQPGQPADNKS